LEKGSMSLKDLNEKHYLLDHLKIHWRKYVPKTRRLTQCRRCQRFGHAATNCKMDYRCVKCLLTHKPGECARKTREGLPSCVNCNAEGHTSSSPDCPVYKRHLEAIDRKKQQQQLDIQRQKQSLQRQQPREFAATRYNWNTKTHAPLAASQPPPPTSQSQNVNTNREYRPTLRNSITQPLPTSQNPLSQLQALQFEFNSDPEIQEAVELFAALVSELKSASSKVERLRILIKFTGLEAGFSSASP
jgi:hypothetical protein